MKLKNIIIAILCLISISAYSQKTIRSDKHKLSFTFNDTIWEPIHALEFAGFKEYAAEAMPHIDLFYGLNPKNSTALTHPYILIGVEDIENPPFDDYIKELNGESIEKSKIEETVGEKLGEEIQTINSLNPIFDREAASIIILSKLEIDEEPFPVINIQVFKLGANKRVMISIYIYDDENKERNLKEFWKIVHNFEFDEKYNKF